MPSVPPAPGLGPLRALERQRPLPDPAGLPPSLPFSLHYTALRPVPLGRRVRGWGRGRRGAGEPRQDFLPKREHPSDRARSAAGTAGLGRLPRTRIAPPPRPEPPDPSVAPSCGAGTRGQAPRGREEAAPAGLGGAGRGRLPGPARRGLGSGILSGRTKAAGEDLAPPNPHPRGLTLNLNLYLTLCPEGGEGTHLTGGSSVHLSWGGGEPGLFDGAGREPLPPQVPSGPGAPPSGLGLEGPGVPALPLGESGC